MGRRLIIFAAVISTTACAVFDTSLPPRPATLDEPGVRVGEGWLRRTVLHEDSRLGSITQIAQPPGSADLAVVGTRSALFFTAATATPRIVQFPRPLGEVELVPWPGGGSRYVDRGGGGWQTGALIAEDGSTLWQPDGGMGMNDIAVGDVDGDKVPEFVVGYNGSGGVHLLDATGKERWQESDGNVWHVEIVDTDEDGRSEIVHSNAAGQMTVRDASGKVLRRSRPDGYFSKFSLVQWPPGRRGLLHAGDHVTTVVEFDGRVRTRFQTPDSGSLADARGVSARLDGGDHLVVAVRDSQWERTQLFVFDRGGTPRYREVMAGGCRAVAAPEEGSFLFGCQDRVFRYSGGR